MILLLAIVYQRIPLNRRFLPLNIISVGIFAGAAGNLIDRVWQGYVTDFLDFTSLPLWNWVFNIADIAVCVGCFLIVLYIFKFDGSEGTKTEGKNGSAE